MKNYNNEIVSIVMPAFRVEGIIGDAIKSVMSQTYTKWELLIADDCSPDGTASVIDHAAHADSRIKLIRCSVNGGPAAARNAALAAAKGRWIAFLDSDDLWLPQKLEQSILYATENRSAITYTGFRRVSYDLSETGAYINVPPSLNYNQLLGNTAIATSTVLVDRELTGDFNMKKVYYDDFVCWLEILKKGFVAHGLDEDLMRYRVVSNSVSRNKKRSAQEVWKIYTQVERLGYFKSALCFVRYAINAFLKYRKF